jgi:hypothetical protein
MSSLSIKHKQIPTSCHFTMKPYNISQVTLMVNLPQVLTPIRCFQLSNKHYKTWRNEKASGGSKQCQKQTQMKHSPFIGVIRQGAQNKDDWYLKLPWKIADNRKKWRFNRHGAGPFAKGTKVMYWLHSPATFMSSAHASLSQPRWESETRRGENRNFLCLNTERSKNQDRTQYLRTAAWF